MEKLITISNRLQDVFAAVGDNPVELPQIVVVGSQSSGKSSVLENIVGRDFLPRGSGIVTRRPLILKLVHKPTLPSLDNHDEKDDGSYGQFLHTGSKRHSFPEIRQEIVSETNRETGINKGISQKPIDLTIYSPKVLNLTLVDLPGITKVPVGDQPGDIEQQIRDMVLHYIKSPNSIILAVTSANQDIANSDAIKIASEVDREGSRTLGVITKIDLMDQGTNALDILLGKVIPLKLGYVGVINRSQQDIMDSKPITDALKHEAHFFATHPAYRSLSARLGTPYLCKVLNRILVRHIKDCLPGLKQQIHSLQQELRQELAQYGGNVLGQDEQSRGALLLTLLSSFEKNFCQAIDGVCKPMDVDDRHTTELFGGARISYIFHKVYAKGLARIGAFDGLSDQAIRTAIRNATGPRPALFVPEVSFENLVKRQIARLEEPSLQCVDLVFDELQRVANQSEGTTLARFARLRERLGDSMNQLLRNHLKPTREMIASLIRMELAYINTNHPDFIGGSRAVSSTLDSVHQSQKRREREREKARHSSTSPSAPVPSSSPSPTSASAVQNRTKPVDESDATDKQKGLFDMVFGDRKAKGLPSGVRELPPSLDAVPTSVELTSPTDREHIETQIIKSLLQSYFTIVRKNIQDAVPKTIMCFLVNIVKDDLNNHLIADIYHPQHFTQLLEENPDIAAKRDNCHNLLQVLDKAMDIVGSVRDFNIS